MGKIHPIMTIRLNTNTSIKDQCQKYPALKEKITEKTTMGI
jgi:hypothetical protein